MKLNPIILTVYSMISLAHAQYTQSEQTQNKHLENKQIKEPVIGGPCQGCDLVFVDIPKHLKSHARIAPMSEQGEPLVLDGVVFDMDMKPAVGIIVYAYQTDAIGKYPKSNNNHGKLRGWAITDDQGSYHFKTIRPGAYPKRNIPQHIHLHVIEPNKGTYYIDDVTFDDDPLLTAEKRMKKPCRAGCGLSFTKRNNQGVWHVQRDIILGKNITNYEVVE